MNKIFLIGRLCNDPTSSQTSSGVKCCRFNLAVNRRFKRDEADFFSITVWREQSENCVKYLKKGSLISLVGSAQTGSYTDKNGIKRNTFDIVADEVDFLTPNETSQAEKQKEEKPQAEPNNDLPF